MPDADHDRAEAAKLPKGDLNAIILTEHATVCHLFDRVVATSGADHKQTFERLTTLLTADETAEESVVRPVTAQAAGGDNAEARNEEEAEAERVIAALPKLDVDSADSDRLFAQLKRAVSDHAEAEETEEFPAVQAARSDQDRIALGEKCLAAFQAAGGAWPASAALP